MISMTAIPQYASHHDICQAAGISYRQADYWARLGVFGDSRAWVPGEGSRRPWSLEMVEALHALARLSELGARVDVFGSVFRVVTARPVDAAGEALIVTRDGAIRRPHWQIDFKIEAAWVVTLRPLAELMSGVAA